MAAGGQGRYGVASAELSRLRRDVTSGPLASLAYSTQASFVRQLGGHAAARRWDGRAATLAAPDAEAMTDALIGLAADALGMGRFAMAAALLARSRPGLDAPGVPARLPLRWEWASAELGLVSGDAAAAAGHAERAAELAAGSRSARHRVKTDVVLAAALCSTGDVTRARAVAERALAATGRLGLIPLRWALAGILVDISGDREVAEVRDGCAELIARRGGVWVR